MAALGCPITGDVKYGDRRANEDRSICLHAFSLRFRHPVSDEEIALFAPPPTQKFWRIFDETVRSLMKPIV
jgi:23S rRNA pseudouridine1911/1915/1917 synthase